MLTLLRTGAWATPARLRAYAIILAAGNLACLIAAFCRSFGFLLPPAPHLDIEFLSFYAAGHLADSHQATAVYALPPAFIPTHHMPAAHVAAEHAVTGDPSTGYMAFFYPPVFLLLCAPLGHLPYLAADALWLAATGIPLAFLLRHLRSSWRACLPALAYIPVFLNAALGETAFLAATLLAAGFLAIKQRPLPAGACFGALIFKPHFLVPITLHLLATRNWPTLAATAASALTLCLASLAAFGPAPWLLYLTITIPHAAWTFANGGVNLGLFVTPGSAATLLGAGAHLATAFELAGLAFAAYCIFRARRAALPIQAAIVCASFPLIIPVMLNYDNVIPGLALPFLLAAGPLTLPWEKTTAAALFMAPLAVLFLRGTAGIPLDPLLPTAFLLSTLRRCR